MVDVDATEATEKPEHDQNDQDQAKNAAQAGPTVAIVAIVAAATAEENNQQDDDKDRAHHSTFLAKFNLPMCRCIRNVPLWFYLFTASRSVSLIPPTAFCTLPSA